MPCIEPHAASRTPTRRCRRRRRSCRRSPLQTLLLPLLPAGSQRSSSGGQTAAAMAFWGCEVKPGKATPFVPPPEASKLHLSQASKQRRLCGMAFAQLCLACRITHFPVACWMPCCEQPSRDQGLTCSKQLGSRGMQACCPPTRAWIADRIFTTHLLPCRPASAPRPSRVPRRRCASRCGQMLHCPAARYALPRGPILFCPGARFALTLEHQWVSVLLPWSQHQVPATCCACCDHAALCCRSGRRARRRCRSMRPASHPAPPADPAAPAASVLPCRSARRARRCWCAPCGRAPPRAWAWTSSLTSAFTCAVRLLVTLLARACFACEGGRAPVHQQGSWPGL